MRICAASSAKILHASSAAGLATSAAAAVRPPFRSACTDGEGGCAWRTAHDTATAGSPGPWSTSSGPRRSSAARRQEVDAIEATADPPLVASGSGASA
jgi:hypothetical protein